ncbi:MAG: DUF3253 domain-containing protein [Lapillicoccus sp.]
MGRQRAPRAGEAEEPVERTCRSCGRRMEERRRWRGHADEVRYCSDSCRRHGVTATDRQLEATILQLLGKRAPTATVCPSEAARAVASERASHQGQTGVRVPDEKESGEETWRPLMEPARRAARRLVASGDVVIVQGGRIVDPSTAKGPIRIRRS